MRYGIKKNKKGFIAVETAIFLPIFLIGVLILVYLIKILWIEERIFYTFEQEARQLSKNVYAEAELGIPGSLNKESFKILLKGKLYAEHPDDIENIKFTEFKFMFTKKGLSGLISAKLNYKLNINLPLRFYEKVPIQDNLLFRGFIGADKLYKHMPFEEMKKEKEFFPVWVFPRAGERYHREYCSYITNKPKQMILNGGVKSKYSPCHLCKPQDIISGGVVYCFTKTGEAYHRGNCLSVDKYVVEMEREEAKDKGYTPCMKCGGA